jgi:hypothetical protein
MKRFTQKCEGKTGVALTFDLDIRLPNMEQVEKLQDMIIRLAAYEDTGLMPEEIKELQEINANYLNAMNVMAKNGAKMAEETAALKSERDVAVRALEMAVPNENDRRCYIQQAKENLQK